MTVFSIGDTNFDVDIAKSSISLEEDGTGMVELNIDIHGDDDLKFCGPSGRRLRARAGCAGSGLYPE